MSSAEVDTVLTTFLTSNEHQLTPAQRSIFPLISTKTDAMDEIEPTSKRLRARRGSQGAAQLVSSKSPHGVLTEFEMKMLNLQRDWLLTFLPYCLKKVNRITFGLMTQAEVEDGLKIDPLMSRSRARLAIPFVGKDVGGLPCL